mgnify:CR=1 FL=1
MNFKTISTFILVLVFLLGGAFLFSLIGKEDTGKETDFSDYQEKDIDLKTGSLEDGDSIDFKGELKKEEDPSFENHDFKELGYKILEKGTGLEVAKGDKISVHYKGMLKDGTKFDSSYDRGTPFSVIVGAGRVIQGWDLGLVGMKKGETRRLFIPSEYGYGERGQGKMIPPNANLVFDVELLKIKKPEK